MSLRLPRLQPRFWIFVWLALLVPVWGVGLWMSVGTITWTRSSEGVMCAGLEAYAVLSHLPPEHPGERSEPRIVYVTDVPDPASAERFFCAQYEAAPYPLMRIWPPGLETRNLSGRRVIVHMDDPAVLQDALDKLQVVAERQKSGLRTDRLAPGLVLVTIAKPGQTAVPERPGQPERSPAR
ncbi:MAG: hypothetical protein ABUL63_04705 [Acidobacteriota bacterium]